MSPLPFGPASGPNTFTALRNWIVEILRARGNRVLVYLDDFLLVNQDQTKLISQTAEVVSLLESLGWQINYLKSILKPTQKIEYQEITGNIKLNINVLIKRKKQKDK